jgi:uncharacterized membrane protein YozB (DUF420 family)
MMNNQPEKRRKREPLIPQTLLIGLALTALLLLGADLQGWAETPGFLGTYAPLIADINLVAQVILIVVLIGGLVAIKRRNTPTHRNLQTAAVLFNVLLVAFIMAGRFFLLYSPGSFDWPVLAHGVLGLCAIVCGIYLTLHMNNRLSKRWQTKKWKLMMRVTWGLFLLVAIGGFVLYRMLYLP